MARTNSTNLCMKGDTRFGASVPVGRQRLTPLRTLASTVFAHPFRQNGVVVMLTSGLAGYFDESGTAPDAGVLVVGGYVAPVSDWVRLERDWSQCLADSGLDPSKQSFHRTVFESRKKAHMRGKKENIYEKMSDSEADALREGLGDAIIRRIIRPGRKPRGVAIAASVVVNDYKAVRGTPLFSVNRYSFCVLQGLATVVSWMREHNVTAPVAYVFEDGAGDKYERFKDDVNTAVNQIFSDAQLRKEYRFNSLTFGSKKDFPQLQAADYLVWDVRRHYLEAARGRTHGLSGPHNLSVRHFDKDAMALNAENFGRMYPGS